MERYPNCNPAYEGLDLTSVNFAGFLDKLNADEMDEFVSDVYDQDVARWSKRIDAWLDDVAEARSGR